MAAIVIDASIARAAGETQHPTSTACRKTLDAMINGQHHLAWSQELKEEWQRHKSNYSHRWLYKMFARKRMRILSNVDESLYPLIVRQVTPQTIGQEAVRKDLHLIGAAMGTDRRIIALDVKLHRFMASACKEIPPLRVIIWLHPVDHKAPEWLMSGAPDASEYHLCDSWRRT